MKVGQRFRRRGFTFVIHWIRDGEIGFIRWKGKWKNDFDWKMANCRLMRVPVEQFEKDIVRGKR
jgi:hypothetical protein